jgi:hypothetical protein
MRQNLGWAIGYNSLALPIAAGVFEPWGFTLRPEIAAISMSGSSVLVAVNALALKRLRLPRVRGASAPKSEERLESSAGRGETGRSQKAEVERPKGRSSARASLQIADSAHSKLSTKGSASAAAVTSGATSALPGSRQIAPGNAAPEHSVACERQFHLLAAGER